MIHLPYTKDKGFALFISVMVAGTMALIAMGIIAVSVRQALITSAGRESQFAFYAADTGAECAIYWDVVGINDPAHPSGKVSAFANTTTPLPIRCNYNTPVGQNLTNQPTANHVYANGYATTTQLLYTFAPNPYCARVTVVKGDDGTTKIESLGYNTCGATNASRRVERAVRVSY